MNKKFTLTTDKFIRNNINGKNSKPWINHSIDNFNYVESFLIKKWDEYMTSLDKKPHGDLSQACTYVSLFIAKVYGATIEGDETHQYNIYKVNSNRLIGWNEKGMTQDVLLDITMNSKSTKELPWAWNHSEDFIKSIDFEECLSLECKSVVNEWLKEFREEHKNWSNL